MISAIYTVDESSFFNKVICVAEDWNYAHVLTAFTENFTPIGRFDGDYFESIHGVDPATGKNGVRGPIPLQNLWDWVDEDPSKHKITIQPLPWFTPTEIMETRQRWMDAVPLISYPPITSQLWDNSKMLLSGYKYGIPPAYRNTTQWDCSESVVRVLPIEFVVNVFNLGDWLYEEYVPGTCRGINYRRGPGIYQMIEEYKERVMQNRFVNKMKERKE